MTVRRAVADLRRGREALSDIQAQLDTLLSDLRSPGKRIDGSAPERLAGARREAGRALAALADLRRLLP